MNFGDCFGRTRCILDSSDKYAICLTPYYDGIKIDSFDIKEQDNRRLLLFYFESITNVLLELSKRKLFHGNLKPNNIFITPDQNVLLVDYCQNLFIQNIKDYRLEDLCYVSPEVIKGEELDISADIWSFGVILYKVYTKESPFQGDTQEIITEHIVKGIYYISNPLIPERIRDLISVILKSKDQRINYSQILNSLHKIFYSLYIKDASLSCSVKGQNDSDNENKEPNIKTEISRKSGRLSVSLGLLVEKPLPFVEIDHIVNQISLGSILIIFRFSYKRYV